MASLKKLIEEIELLEILLIECKNKLSECKCYTKGLKWNDNSCAYDAMLTAFLFPKNTYIRDALKPEKRKKRYTGRNDDLRQNLDDEIDKIIEHIDNPKTKEVSCTDYRRILRNIRINEGTRPIMGSPTGCDELHIAFETFIDEYNLNNILFIGGECTGDIDMLFDSYESPQKIVDAKGFRSNHTIVCINYNYGKMLPSIDKMFNSININGRTLYLHAVTYQCWGAGGHFCSYIKCGNKWYDYDGLKHNHNMSWQGPKEQHKVIAHLNNFWGNAIGSFVAIYWDEDDIKTELNN